MKKLIRIYIRLFTLIAISTGILSCKKFVAVDPPKTAITSTELFSTEQGAISAVTGLYSQMSLANLNITNGGVTVYSGLSSDEIVNTSTNATFDQFKNNALASDNSVVSSRFWTPAYRIIYQANAILEGLLSSSTLSTPVKNQLKGEMLLVRALHYFYLVNCFGDVPFITITDYKVNGSYPRTGSANIYSSMISDLKEAQNLLQESYPTTTKGRPNKWTVTALLARIYLYQKDWANAEALASNIINSGKYNLVSNLTTVFTPSSQEVIWLLQRDNNNTAEGITFVPTSSTARPQFAITNSLLGSFEAADNRKNVWLQKNVVSGQTYYYPYKHKIRASTPITEYLVIFRLAEIYLIRAEAQANQNKLTQAESDLNLIRTRAGLTTISGTNMAGLLNAIGHERQIELFAEWGHRWFDLKRTGSAEAVLSQLKGSNWQNTDQLYPLPFGELQVNPFLTQNPGY